MTGPQYPDDQQLAHETETSTDASAAAIRAVTDALGTLETLGAPESIAAYLAESDVDGVRVKSADCPVSNYVRAATGQSIAVCQDLWTVVVGEYESHHAHSMPRNVGEFIALFDNGQYPQLDRDQLAHPATS